MRRILPASEYGIALQKLSVQEKKQTAETILHASEELMRRYSAERTVLLCDEPLHEIAFRSADMLRERERGSVVALLSRDELPDLSHGVICDLLFPSACSKSRLQKREEWIRAMAKESCPILSVAIPAGVDPDTGRAKQFAVQAEITVAPGAYLRGLLLHDGLDHCGEIRPVGGEVERGDGLFRFEGPDANRLLPPRKRTAHKGDSGKALLCVGSPKYIGAALLSARACLAAGCGILFVACPDEVRTALGRLPEAIGIPVGRDWNEESCLLAIQALEGMKALGLGCGVGGGDISSLLEAALRTGLPLVMDADGLNCLSRHPRLYPLLHEKVILTPHPGEMSRLTGLPSDTILDTPVDCAVRYARQWGCTVLLKGAATVVSDGTRTRIVAEGNAGLGKGGSGDALTGIITGLLSQGVEPFAAACLGSYLLGTSAVKAFELLKERMLRATHVIEALEDWNE